MVRPVAVLVVICLIASALLGFTNEKTAPVIEENQRAAQEEAMREALPQAESFESLPVSGELADMGVTGVYRDSGGSGYVVTSANRGYGSGDVTVTVGLDPAGAIVHVGADVSTQTQGIGTKVGERELLDRFNGLTGGAEDVELRSGATYTSDAVRNGVDAAFAAVAALLG